MYHSSACWRTAASAQTHFKKLTSVTAKREAVKDQIRIRVLGFGWDDLHHPWSKDGVAYTPEQLLGHLINKIIPEQKKRTIPKTPPIDLPSRKDRYKLGTTTADVGDLDERRENKKKTVIEGGKKLREEMEEEGKAD